MDTVKHDVLSFQKQRFYSVANTCYLSKKFITSGYLFVDGLVDKQIWISSGTGVEYLIDVPDYMLEKISASQFNVSFNFKESRNVKVI